jgi:hypothetical protein
MIRRREFIAGFGCAAVGGGAGATKRAARYRAILICSGQGRNHLRWRRFEQASPPRADPRRQTSPFARMVAAVVRCGRKLQRRDACEPSNIFASIGSMTAFAAYAGDSLTSRSCFSGHSRLCRRTSSANTSTLQTTVSPVGAAGQNFIWSGSLVTPLHPYVPPCCQRDLRANALIGPSASGYQVGSEHFALRFRAE